ncbi:MAG: hypothetical protein WAN35_18920 [Terracidiphilus sp.]
MVRLTHLIVLPLQMQVQSAEFSAQADLERAKIHTRRTENSPEIRKRPLVLVQDLSDKGEETGNCTREGAVLRRNDFVGARLSPFSFLFISHLLFYSLHERVIILSKVIEEMTAVEVRGLPGPRSRSWRTRHPAN